jgi:hypothetical protein
MPNPEDIRNATQRVDQAQRLIQETQSARREYEPTVRTIQDDIDRTRRVSDMMSNLAHLIEGISDGPQRA